MRRMLVILAALAALPALAQSPPDSGAASVTLPNVLGGKVFPLSRTLKSLDETWFRVNIASAADATGATSGMMGALLGGSANVVYTRGDLISVGGETFIVGYHEASGGGLAALMRAEMGGSKNPEPAEPKKLTADTELLLTVLNLRNVGSFSDMRTFDLEKELADAKTPDLADTIYGRAAESAKQASAASNLKQIGTAVLMYTDDYDGRLPRLKDAETVKKAIMPYVKADAVFNDPANGEPFVPNAHYSAKPLSSVPSPSEAVLFYQKTPASDGGREVLFVDGHVKKVDAREWQTLIKDIGYR